MDAKLTCDLMNCIILSSPFHFTLIKTKNRKKFEKDEMKKVNGNCTKLFNPISHLRPDTLL